MGLTRRDFIKNAGLGVAAFGFGRGLPLPEVKFGNKGSEALLVKSKEHPPVADFDRLPSSEQMEYNLFHRSFPHHY